MQIIKNIADAWSRYRARNARINELRALGDNDIRRLMEDTGLSYADLVTLAKCEGDSASLLYRRMSEMGLDPSKIDASILRDMQRCCSECRSKARCEHELEDKPKAAAWPSYCPNRQTLEALNRIAAQ